MKKSPLYVIGSDIGGTTFSSTLYDTSLHIINSSPKATISNYPTTERLIDGICDQIIQLQQNAGISSHNLKGIGLACPGPLDAKSGKILNTPNLTLLQNIHITALLEKRLNNNVFLENDANLFTLGEYVFFSERQPSVLIGITLGTGVGFGIVLDGQFFTGAHGLGAEYGISPDGKEKTWEDGISIRGLNKMSIHKFGKLLSPKELFDLANIGNLKALELWSIYGIKLGTVLSHVINMLDPDIISIGGGISHAFPYFKESMITEIIRYSPAYSLYNPTIIESIQKEKSAMLGAAKMVCKY